MALIHAEPACCASTCSALRGPPVRRGRRPALVASAVGPRRAHALLRRLALAAARDLPLCRRHRGHRGARRDGAVPRRARRSSRRGLLLRSAGAFGRVGTLYDHCVRAVRPWPAVRRARPAADGLRRLERRHEYGRHARQGRERLAGLLSLRRPAAVSPRSPAARRSAFRRALHRRSRPAAQQHRGACAGTASGTAVPTSTTARRSARRRTPSARSIRSRKAGRCCQGPATPERVAHGDGSAGPASRAPRRKRSIQLLDPPFDKSDLDPGYIKGYVPGRAGERRPVHACRDLGGDGIRRAGRRAARLGTAHA